LPPAPAYNWTGFYVGGNIGYGWGHASTDFAFAQDNTGGQFDTLNANDSNRLNGVIGGVPAGYNWQMGMFVYGIEADWQTTSQRGSDTFASSIFVPDLGFNGNSGSNPVTISSSEELQWFGTVRGRVGTPIADHFLIYATGGLAYGKIDLNGSVTPGNPDPVIQNNHPAVWYDSTIKVGWTIGAGLEGQISGNWTWKFEYLYLDLGKVTANAALPAGNCYGTGGVCNGPLPNAGGGTVSSRITDNIPRVGLNYQFH